MVYLSKRSGLECSVSEPLRLRRIKNSLTRAVTEKKSIIYGGIRITLGRFAGCIRKLFNFEGEVWDEILEDGGGRDAT